MPTNFPGTVWVVYLYECCRCCAWSATALFQCAVDYVSLQTIWNRFEVIFKNRKSEPHRLRLKRGSKNWFYVVCLFWNTLILKRNYICVWFLYFGIWSGPSSFTLLKVQGSSLEHSVRGSVWRGFGASLVKIRVFPSRAGYMFRFFFTNLRYIPLIDSAQRIGKLNFDWLFLELKPIHLWLGGGFGHNWSKS